MAPSICRHDFRDTIMCDPSIGEVVNDGLGVHIGNRNCHRPSCEPVDDGEQVVVAVRLRHGNQIHVEMLETSSGDLEICYWRDDVPLDLCLLARKALSGPLTDVLADVGPDKFV